MFFVHTLSCAFLCIGVMVAAAVNCSNLDSPENVKCADVVRWAQQGGKWDIHADEWFKDMKAIAGVSYADASLEDWQKLYFCAPPGGKQCGSPPCSCTKEPCNVCYGGSSQSPADESEDCAAGHALCKPPTTALEYNGRAWPTKTVEGTGPHHIFAIGDWGGLDGTLNPIQGRPQLVAYDNGNMPGPSVFPRTRWNKPHSELLCSHKQFVACYDSKGQLTQDSEDSPGCVEGCGFVAGIDDRPQLLVAQAFKGRAAKNSPAIILNVGDNFYWGGIEKDCGTPMTELSYPAHHQYTQVFESVYNGPGVDKVPWYSVLGNHDWGGFAFNNGWDQQIAYTWKSDRWVMPAAYYTAQVIFKDAGFTMELFMTDSNAMDADDPEKDPNHNMCSAKNNPPGASCSSQGGPASVETCKKWFWDLWDEQKAWLPKKLDESTADWQVLVTHFPCGHQSSFYQEMHNAHGLDLMVTGHRHDQELWAPDRLGGLTCFVTGGGGGISSEATPNMLNQTNWYGEAQYGFYDLTVTRDKILIESINWNGSLMASASVHPSTRRLLHV
eukprot:TRINITY_DN4830_c1_g1_i1.p1 TRINITY_DN4830_c1_g1~~TRINITY_DN4830_c1_g1_i1.p1  ORF type:complete len:553 (+),score=100.02 TRINITY_DN4830_c1_g1_i1:133-1791(+)